MKNTTTLSKHLTKDAAHRAATRIQIADASLAREYGHSSGNAKLRYAVQPYLHFFWKVVQF